MATGDQQELMEFTNAGTDDQQLSASHVQPDKSTDHNGIQDLHCKTDVAMADYSTQQPLGLQDNPAEVGYNTHQPLVSYNNFAQSTDNYGFQNPATYHDKVTEAVIQQPQAFQDMSAQAMADYNTQQPLGSQEMLRAVEVTEAVIQQPQASHDKSAESADSSNDGQQPLTSPDNSAETLSQNKDGVHVTLSVQWSKNVQPNKYKIELQKVLQSWANSIEAFKGDCEVINASEDGSALICLKPAPALSDLEKLNGDPPKERDKKKITTMSVVSVRQIPEDASPSAMSQPKDEQVSLGEQGAAVPTAELSCSVAVSHFWYVNHIYKEEIERIAKENGVTITSDVKVTFQADQNDGRKQKAYTEFTSLVQKCLGESEGSSFPLKYADEEKLKDALRIVQSKESKLLLTVSSEEMTACGPSQSQEALKKSLIKTPISTSVGESAWGTQDTHLSIGTCIKDPLVTSGLTVEESCWKLINTSFKEKVTKIKSKFGVDFKESFRSQGEVEVRACYRKSEGNESMESHAVRALLHLYQRFKTSPRSPAKHHRADWLTEASEGAAGGPALEEQSEYKNEAPTEEGATAGENNDDKCPICIDAFTKKKQLKCKHEFCEECLESSVKTMGPICPVCRRVFGVVQGDQPSGKMTWNKHSYPLPGYSGCGTINITYTFLNGRQASRHPNPGQPYYGTTRTAYLPDNKEGNEVLMLLERAFDQSLVFTIGTSRTTGVENQVTWNDIHHKTSTTGGPENFGYPDPDYLSRVKEELKAKGIE